jgi:hypothetical protein
MTRGGRLFEPASDRDPGDSLYRSNRGLVQSLDSESGNLIESCMTELESMLERAGIEAECLTSSAATISTVPPPPGFVESVADDVSEGDLSRQWTFAVWAAETLHCF